MLTGKEAHGADVGRLLLVAPLVEEAADLVHPAVAHIALNPSLLRLLIILPLLQLILYTKQKSETKVELQSLKIAAGHE